jgi:hypothetical protein
MPGASVATQIQLGRSVTSSPQPNQRTTGDDGTWLYENLEPDRPTTIIASANGYGRASAPVALEARKRSEVTVTLKKADSFLAGMVVDDRGNALPGLHLMAMSQSNQSERKDAVTDEAGRFRFTNFMSGDTILIFFMDDPNPLARSQRFISGHDDVLITHRAPTTLP